MCYIVAYCTLHVDIGVYAHLLQDFLGRQRKRGERGGLAKGSSPGAQGLSWARDSEPGRRLLRAREPGKRLLRAPFSGPFKGFVGGSSMLMFNLLACSYGIPQGASVK